MILANLLLAQLPLALQSERGKTFWLPPEGSTAAPGVDSSFYFVYWICVFFFVGIVAAMVIFVIRYRSTSGRKRKKAPDHNMALEITWTVIPLILVIAIFWWNFKSYVALETAPAGSYEINVTAQKWKWLFTYPNGYVTEELHIPAGVPVQLIMQSQDVIHSFFVPDFRVKHDVVPGRINKVWFEAPEPGEHWILCAEYCGTGHSNMLAHLIVQTPDDFKDWMSHADDKYMVEPPAEAGKAMYMRFGCAQCHSTDGKAGTGPSFKDIYNENQKLADGSSVLVDENYIHESIIDPEAKVVAGFQPVMPTFQGKIKDQQIGWIIAYIKTLSSHTPQSDLDAAQTAPPEKEEDEGAAAAKEGGGTQDTDSSETEPAPESPGQGDNKEQGE